MEIDLAYIKRTFERSELASAGSQKYLVTAAPEAKASGRFADIGLLEDGLWEKYSSLSRSRTFDVAYALGLSPQCIDVFKRVLGPQTLLRRGRTAHDGVEEFMRDIKSEQDLIVFGDFYFDGPEEAIDCLLRMRSKTAAPILFVSKFAKRPDYSGSRSPICDITLVAPVNCIAVQNAIFALADAD